MKMKIEHQRHIHDAIENYVLTQGFTTTDLLIKSDSAIGWDLWHAAGLSKWACDNLYHYLDDGHLTTAIVQTVKRVRATLGALESVQTS
jgi:hypothetical protein